VSLNEARKLFRCHQNVDEVSNVNVVIKRDVLLKRAIKVSRILGNHCQCATCSFG
jgi:hypothetical protein